MTTPFAAAISHLTNRLNSRGEGSEREELRQAIRVLEAAGKVDKARATRAMNKGWITPLDVRALLEALPDKEEK